MSGKQLNVVAVLLLLLAVGAVAWAIRATLDEGEIQGPSALVVLPDQSVWMSVDEALWHLDANGHRVGLVEGATIGIAGRIGNLVLHPDGQMVAQVRDDATLYFLDTATAAIQARLLPQWPGDLAAHGSNAINYAFHGDGRVAIATGGGHTVAVFDREGRLLGRTKQDTYKFTNGLWWKGDVLWTTDTNRQQLVELEGATLTEKSRVALSRNCGGWQYLGAAVASNGAPDEQGRQPLATLIRFANGMIKGHASDVYENGEQMNFPVVSTPEPRDIKWQGKTLLMVDGADFSIKRYSDDHVALDDFGDDAVRSELNGMLQHKASLARQHAYGLIAAVGLFLLGFGLALRAQMLEKSKQLHALNVDLSQLRTPLFSDRVKFITSLKIFWPLLLMVLLPVLLTRSAMKFSLSHIPFIGLLWLIVGLSLVPVLLLFRQLRKYANAPELEAIFNAQATLFIQKSTVFWETRQSDELPQEVLGMMSAWKGWQLVVLTNQRLLVFAGNLRDRKLARASSLAEIQDIDLLIPEELGWWQRLQSYLNPARGVLRIRYLDGTELLGNVPTSLPARRMAQQFQAIREGCALEAGGVVAAETAVSTSTGLEAKLGLQMMASFLVPGLGQWMQRRSGTGLLFFIIWVLQLFSIFPGVWAWWNVTREVPTSYIIISVTGYWLVCAIAAFDVWRMRKTQ